MTRFLFTALAVSCLVGAASAQSSVTMRVTGQKQGQFKGDSKQKGRENELTVDSFDHTIVSPRDPATGLATGRRQHKPFSITKSVSSAAWVQFHQAMSTNENLPQIFIDINSINGGGGQSVDRTIQLKNASVASIEDVFLPAVQSVGAHQAMIITFTYQTIEWDWHPGGVNASDDWAQNLGMKLGRSISHLAMR